MTRFSRRLTLTSPARSLCDEKVANRNVRDFGWEIAHGPYATPADFPPHDGTPYRELRARRRGLGFVHHSRTVPNPKVTIFKLCTAVWQGLVDACIAGDVVEVCGLVQYTSADDSGPGKQLYVHALSVLPLSRARGALALRVPLARPSKNPRTQAHPFEKPSNPSPPARERSAASMEGEYSGEKGSES
jgi:hypothetical protein